MARIQLIIDDPAQQLTLRTMLEAEGHETVQDAPETVIADLGEEALRCAGRAPTIVIATASQVPEAVRAMKQGVYGYVFVPFQPAEASLMVERALAAPGHEHAPGQGTAMDEIVTLEETETKHIQQVLRLCKHNRAKAARLLGIGRNTLWRKLKKVDQRSAKAGPGQTTEPVP